MATMTAREAAQRMGVKVETLYAYVSRGLLESHTRSRRAHERVRRRRDRGARAARPTPTEQPQHARSTCSSKPDLTDADRHRGCATEDVRADDLARTHTFEHVAELLWSGSLAGVRLPWRAPTVQVPDDVDPITALQVAVALLGAHDPGPHGTGRARSPRSDGG